ncbi:type IV secretion system protein [uncultured Sphingomonas sp.]|uniref:type IV secretion system protein n=1 Tax=uncultured Sphingomonas sp. TaxID=158754 RepID=UPI0025E3FD11|nr:type IV secretion system protein [uncultured Sphingomonas sp.]
MPVCAPITPGAPFLSSMVAYLDCQAQSLGAGGYAALSAAGATGPVVLSSVLVLFIALFGFRMLFGQVPQVRDGVLAAVKIGVVLALATSWPAYRTLVYDVTLRAPADLGATIGAQAGLPGAGGGMVAWLQSADNAYLLLAYLGTEPTRPRTDLADPVARQQARQGQGQGQGQQIGADGLPIRPDPGFDALMLGLARIVYLVGTIAALATVRLVAGLLLALGPVFAIFLLFDGTRGLFEGWVRGLVGAALGALATAIVLGVELAFLQPWLFGLIAQRQADLSISGVPVELFALQLVFGIALIGVLVAAGRIAFSLRLPAALSNWSWTSPVPALPAPEPRPAAADARQTPVVADDRSRAHTVADAITATQRREAAAGTPAVTGLFRTGTPTMRTTVDPAVVAPTPIGQSYRRRTRPRISAGVSRRDKVR